MILNDLQRKTTCSKCAAGLNFIRERILRTDLMTVYERSSWNLIEVKVELTFKVVGWKLFIAVLLRGIAFFHAACERCT